MSELVIEPQDMWTDLVPGESIAVNGVCLTVTSFDAISFTADVSLPTLNDTNLGGLANGAFVHLERALKVGDRLGGHIVQGHVDEVGHIQYLREEADNVFMCVSASKNLLSNVIKKGSIAVNGVSLTVQDLTATSFTVVLIPHTFKETVFAQMRAGSPVNLETDLFAKYAKRFISSNNDSPLSVDFLRENGF